MRCLSATSSFICSPCSRAAESPYLKRITALVGFILVAFGITLVATLSHPNAPLIIGASSLACGAALLIATAIILASRLPAICKVPSTSIPEPIVKLTLDDFQESNWIRGKDALDRNYYGIRGEEDHLYLLLETGDGMEIYFDGAKINLDASNLHQLEFPAGELKLAMLGKQPIISGSDSTNLAFFAAKLRTSGLFVLADTATGSIIYINGEKKGAQLLERPT